MHARIVHQCLRKAGFHDAGKDCIDPNPLWPVFLCERLGQAHEPRLGHRVDGLSGHGYQGDDRSDVDDAPSPAPGHQRHSPRHQVVRPLQVDIHRLVEGFRRETRGRSEIGVGRGVVDQDIEPAVVRANRPDQAVDLLYAPGMATPGLGLATLRDDRIRHGLYALHASAAHDHVRAAARKTSGDGLPDAA